MPHILFGQTKHLKQGKICPLSLSTKLLALLGAILVPISLIATTPDMYNEIKPYKKLFEKNTHFKDVQQGHFESLPRLEDYALTLLERDCQSVESLKLPAPHKSYHGKDAQRQCLFEQELLRAIVGDEREAYERLMREYAQGAEGKNKAFERFVYFAAQSPQLNLTPLMFAVVFHSPQIFHSILARAPEQILSVMGDWHTPLVALSHSISESSPTPYAKPYDSNGVSALDLSAMYQRYDFFYALLEHGAPPISSKHPHSSGLITFGDGILLELLLSVDERFLEHFGANKLLHFAAREGNIELLEYLIVHKNVDINALKLGESALDAALNGKNIHKKPQLEAALKLIELGAKPSEGNTRRIEKLKNEKTH